MKYVFKCANEKCSLYNKEVEIEQRISEEHKASCEECGKEMQRVFTPFTIGRPQGMTSMGGYKIPAQRQREMERKREEKVKKGGGEYWPNRRRKKVSE